VIRSSFFISFLFFGVTVFQVETSVRPLPLLVSLAVFQSSFSWACVSDISSSRPIFPLQSRVFPFHPQPSIAWFSLNTPMGCYFEPVLKFPTPVPRVSLFLPFCLFLVVTFFHPAGNCYISPFFFRVLLFALFALFFSLSYGTTHFLFSLTGGDFFFCFDFTVLFVLCLTQTAFPLDLSLYDS